MTAGSFQELIDSLRRALGLPPTSATSAPEAAGALLELTARPEVAWTRVWVHPEPAEAGVSVTLAPQGGEGKAVVRQHLARPLQAQLVEALSLHTGRGADRLRPERGLKPLESGWQIRAAFQTQPHGEWVTLSARPPPAGRALRELPLEPAAVDLLDATLAGARRPASGTRLLLLSGLSGSGRSTTLRALFDALPDELRICAASSPPLPADPRLADAAAPGEPLSGALRSIRRHDPDVVIADELETDEELQLFAATVLGGAGALGVMRAESPERAVQRLHEAFEGVGAQQGTVRPEATAWILHHRAGAPLELYTALIGSDAAPGPRRWQAQAPV